MADYRRIMAMVLEHRTYDFIVSTVGCSRREVSAVSKVIKTYGVTAGGAAAMGNAELAALFPDGRKSVSEAYEHPDFTGTLKSMKANRHFTLQQGWRLYVSVQYGPGRKYGYSKYCQLFARYVAKNDLVATLHHEPGQTLMVDWAGDTLAIVDRVTGQVHKAYLFLATLPFSGYVFCQAFLNMKQNAWNTAHVNAFEFFGGVSQIVVPDNAATATHRPVKGEAARVITSRYQQLADHYGTAIVPARTYKPRDKSAVESSVNTVNKRVIGYLAEEEWDTIDQLNLAISERIWEVNHEIRRANGTTRYELFAAEEASELKALPVDKLDTVEWKELKVGRNYHVTADYQHYSVPYQMAGQLVRVRLTSLTVTVFEGASIVCEYPRKTGRKGQYSTLAGHAPKQHQNVAGLWSRDWFVDRARCFGPATVQAIEAILDRHKIEAQGYLDCQNILATLGKKNKQRLEAACQQVINQHGYPTYTTLKRVMATITSDAKAAGPVVPAASTRKNMPASPPETADVLVRGVDYYQERG